MARRRFFVDRIHDGLAQLTGADARHLARVLRAEPGQRYELSDNHQLYLAEISDVSPARVAFRIVETLPAEATSARITLYAALIKFDRFEWIVEKATELGVARIVPINTDRSEKGLAAAAQKRIERWRKIARESAEQSRRLSLPEIATAGSFASALADPSPYRYFLEEQTGAEPLLAALPPSARRTRDDVVALLIGPEGGWTDREREAARAAQWRAVSLARNVLRAETAAIAALAIIAGAW